MLARKLLAATGSHPLESWTKKYNPEFGEDLYDIERNGSLFVAVGSNGTVITSSDGINWTKRTSGATKDLWRVIWDGSKFVAVGGQLSFHAQFAYSSDGITWTATTNTTYPDQLIQIAYGGSAYVAIGKYGAVYTSSDGMSWTHVVDFSSYGDVIWDGSKFVLLADGKIKTSTNGSTWSDVYISYTNTYLGIVWSGSMYVVVGDGGAILTSSDGLTWTSRASGTSTFLLDVIYANSLFVVTGLNGLILTSSDGINWETKLGGNSSQIYDVSWLNNRFIGPGGSGTLTVSEDGITWDKFTIDTGLTSLLRIAYGSSRYVVVGSGGMILTYP